MIKSPTIQVAIYMAGDIMDAKRICRAYCYKVGLCVTIEPIDYIYTGGEEAGFRIGFINYPRFPSEQHEILKHARILANTLLDALSQHSFSIVGPEETEWFSRRSPEERRNEHV